MITIENEYYLRSILLLCEGGSYITKKIIFRELPKRGGDLDALLKYEQFEKRVRNEFRNKNQLDILFPTTGKTDVNTWDVQMLTGIIQILFWSDLETKERKHVKEIKRLRIVIAHSPSAALHEDEYRDFIKDLAKAITFLALKFEKAIQKKCTDCIKKYESCPLDVNSSIERLKELQYTDDQFRKILEEIEQSRAYINDATTKIRTDIAETTQTLSNQFNTFQAVLESVERMLKTEPLKRIRAIVKSRLTFSGDDEVDDLAEKMLLKVMNAAIKRAKDPTDPEEVRKAVDEIFEEIDKIAGVKILSAKSECIVIRIQCETYKGLYDVLMYVTSQTYHQRLSAIADALCSHLQTSKPLTLRSDLPQECLQNIADEIGEAERAKRSIMLPIQCETKDGVENLLNLFESDVLSKKFHKLSEALSKELKGHVSVKAAVNEIGYIDTAEGNNTLYEKKHISFGNQSQPRNEGKTISAHAPSLEKKLVVAAIDIGTSFTAYAHSFESDFKRDHFKICNGNSHFENSNCGSL
ncbi:uncharacterized protein LOC123537584 isoform X2 [Mercenaria mercenaria]|uniref:uncharacterized protein LOC123537584 isoform X2 n=1 Tax=Mercenaria mercenaria TaxID=6596 RepID=UPI00234F7FC7|nr:uncharacterized protein LOC123537584 isoform X2 [Mercenaria mercenaria]